MKRRTRARGAPSRLRKCGVRHASRQDRRRAGGARLMFRRGCRRAKPGDRLLTINKTGDQKDRVGRCGKRWRAAAGKNALVAVGAVVTGYVPLVVRTRA